METKKDTFVCQQFMMLCILVSLFLLTLFPSSSHALVTIPNNNEQSGLTVSVEKQQDSTHKIIIKNRKKRFVSVILQDADTNEILTPVGAKCSLNFGDIIQSQGRVAVNGIFPPAVQTLTTQVDFKVHKNVKVKIYGPPFQIPNIINNYTHKQDEAALLVIPALNSLVFDSVWNLLSAIAADATGTGNPPCQDKLEGLALNMTKQIINDLLGDCAFISNIQNKIPSDIVGAYKELRQKIGDYFNVHSEEIVAHVGNAFATCGVSAALDSVVVTTGVGAAINKDPSAYELISGEWDIATSNTYEEFLIQNLPPVVTVNATPQAGLAPLTVNFALQALFTPTEISKVEWDFNNDGTYEQSTTATTLTKTFNDVGNYTVNVRVTDGDGQTATIATAVGVVAAGTPLVQKGTLNDTVTSVKHPLTVQSDGLLSITLNIDSTLNIGSGNVAIYGSDGTTQLNHWTGPTGGTSVTGNYTYALKAGTYYIKLTRMSGYGGYTLTNVFTEQPLPNDREPNDDHLSAKEIRLNSTATGHLGYNGGSGNNTDIVDFHKLIVPADGLLTITLTIDSTLDIDVGNIAIYGADGATKLTGAWAGPTGGSNITGTYTCALKAGTYYIRLNRDTGYGGYTLTNVFTAQPLSNDLEPNDDYLSAKQINLNDSTAGHLGYIGGNGNNTDIVDWYKLIAPMDGFLTITLTIDSTLSIGTAYVAVYGSDGTTELYHWSGPTGGSNITGTYTCALKAGTYYIKLTRSSGYGGYTLTNVFTVQPLQNDIEPNDDYLAAKQININSSTTGHLGYIGPNGNTADSVDWYKLTAPADGLLTIMLTIDATLNIGSGYVSLYGADGTTQLKAWSGPTGGSNLTGSYTYSLKAGTYYIKLARYSGYGGYTLRAFLGKVNPAIDSFIINPQAGIAPLKVGVHWDVSHINPTEFLTCKIDMNGDGTPEFTITNCTSGTKSYIYNAVGTYTPTLTVADSANNSVQQAANVTAGTAIISASPLLVNFGYIEVGSQSEPQTISLSNSGNMPLTIKSIALADMDQTPFIVANTCTTIAPGATCSFTVHFSPHNAVASGANMVISSNDPSRPTVNVSLNGTGVVTGTNATIKGSVITSIAGWNNLAVADAKVTIRETNQYVNTNAAGEFVLANVTPGTYTLDITSPNFKPITQVVTVAPGQVLELKSLPPMVINLCQGLLGDVSGDGKVGIADVIYALQILAGLRN